MHDEWRRLFALKIVHYTQSKTYMHYIAQIARDGPISNDKPPPLVIAAPLICILVSDVGREGVT